MVKNHISKTLIKCPAALALKIIYKHKQSSQISRTNLYPTHLKQKKEDYITHSSSTQYPKQPEQ